jgi:hypothetical protein
VPFSVTSCTSQLIQDQRAHTIADVVANDPAVHTALGYGTTAETKVADDKPMSRVTVEGSASGEIGTRIDLGRRFGDNGQRG